jgi:methionyl-tRNA formyltransferase
MVGKRVVIVGNGRMAQACAETLLRDGSASVGLLVAERRDDAAQMRLAAFCNKVEIPILQPSGSINSTEVVAAVAAQAPDLILSIDNFQIFGAALLGAARDGCINFHNGPLERYRGVNVPSWAIFNGEETHGIAWHYMVPAVDAGPIAVERRFALTGTETALSLTLDCVRIGLTAFAEDLPRILEGDRSPAPHGAPRNCRRAELPDGGFLSLQSSAAHIDRLLRATDFRPWPNAFTYARLRTPRGDLIVNEARAVGAIGQRAAGEIVRADRELIVACADGLLSLEAVMLHPDEPVDTADAVEALGLRTGQRLI